jgi:ribosomal protein S18 acetylase RimI-like enzyme
MSAQTFTFERPEYGPLTVCRVRGAEALPTVNTVSDGDGDIAYDALTTMRQAYLRGLAAGSELLPWQAVDSHFRSNLAGRVAFGQRMRKAERAGAAYWIAYQPTTETDTGERAVGLIKASPSRPGWRRWGDPNCYINDIAAHPPEQGIGSACLYTVLSQYPNDREVVLDAYAGNTAANEWFESLGLSEKRFGRADPTEIDGYSLDMVRMGGATVMQVTRQLWEANNWLSSVEKS